MKMGPIDRDERKALLFAVLFSCLFIVFFAVSRPLSRRSTVRRESFNAPPPSRPDKFGDSRENEGPPEDPLEKFRIKPKPFWKIDFSNYSYGTYTFADGSKIKLELQDWELHLPNYSGWFALKDVYYTDLTGDGKAEAIVWLNHVSCGASCNGHASLFYVFTEKNGKLEQIWQYETGSYAYGCGVSSFTAGSNHEIVLELFGRCPKPGMEYPGPAKFKVKDVTFILFQYNGKKFVRKQIEFYDSAPINLQNYHPIFRLD